MVKVQVRYKNGTDTGVLDTDYESASDLLKMYNEGKNSDQCCNIMISGSTVRSIGEINEIESITISKS